ncbi:MAG: four helix bundle protein [Bacteroidetes bacterium]|nr:four helix bundle protein [Bacteroidota bacterium]
MIIRYAETLEMDRKYIIARQLLKSGTSIGANVIEAQSAESKADFIHKLKIADKEAHETWYWMYLCQHSEGYHYDRSLAQKLDEIMRLLNAIIKTGKTNS